MASAWIPFYRSMASALLAFSQRKRDLFTSLKQAANDQPLMNYLHFENEAYWRERDNEIDPFSVMAIFNRHVSQEHRHELAAYLAKIFNVTEAAPQVFHGIAFLDPRHSIYNGNMEMWNLAKVANKGNRDQSFISAWDAARNVKGNGLSSLSIGLFWLNPEKYMPLDALSLPYIQNHYDIAPPPEKCSGAEYMAYLEKLDKKNTAYPAIAFNAWNAAHG